MSTINHLAVLFNRAKEWVYKNENKFIAVEKSYIEYLEAMLFDSEVDIKSVLDILRGIYDPAPMKNVYYYRHIEKYVLLNMDNNFEWEEVERLFKTGFYINY